MTFIAGRPISPVLELIASSDGPYLIAREGEAGYAQIALCQKGDIAAEKATCLVL